MVKTDETSLIHWNETRLIILCLLVQLLYILPKLLGTMQLSVTENNTRQVRDFGTSCRELI
jgi:hypothetical protein